jgi:hypothetical protein
LRLSRIFHRRIETLYVSCGSKDLTGRNIKVLKQLIASYNALGINALRN